MEWTAWLMAWGFIGRLYAIRCALEFDLRDLNAQPASEANRQAAHWRLWYTNMDAHHIVSGGGPRKRSRPW